MNNYKEPLLDIKELFWRVLSQWKAILIIALIVGLVLPVVKHSYDIKSYNLSLEEQKNDEHEQASQGSSIDGILGALPESDRAAVVNAIKHRDSILKSSSYLQASILMNLDLYNERVFMFGFRINGQKEDINALYRSFSNAFDDDALVKIAQAIGKETDTEYIRELISIVYDYNSISEASDMLSIQIAVPEDASIDSVSNTLKDIMQARSRELSDEISDNTIELIYSDESRIVDQSSANKKYDAVARMNSLQTNLKNALSAMSDTQVAAYNSVIGILEAENTSTDQEEALSPPGYSKKYALVGFIMGAALYIMFLIISMFFSGKISSASTAEYYSGKRVICEIKREREKTLLNWLLHSSVVDRLRFGKQSIEGTINNAVSSAKAICEHVTATRMPLFILSGKNSDSDRNIEAIIEGIESNNISSSKISILDDCGNIDENKVRTEEMALLLIQDDKVNAKDLGRLMVICDYYKTDIKGIIYEREIAR